MSEPLKLTVLSLGAGVQSTVLALMACEGVLPKPDLAIFADTGWEPKRVYDHLAKLGDVMWAAGIRLYKVSNGNLRNDAIDPLHRYASIPYFVQNEPGPCERCAATGVVGGDAEGDDDELTAFGEEGKCPRCRGTGWDDGKGMGRRQCTSEYKLAPITRKVREMLGALPPDYRRVPKGNHAEQWIGFSSDEIGRVSDKGGVSYVTKRYPLIEMNMTRNGCLNWLNSRGWSSVQKSACIGCPYHGNAQWRDLRDNHPDEWADAVAFDEAIRKGGARGLPLNGEAFLHRSRVPLSIAPIDHRTRTERRGDQLDLLDEMGDPDGCSPYACRSGLAEVAS